MRPKLFVLLAGLLVSTAALSQAWPSKPIRVIVPMPPGSGQDILSRKIGEELRPRLNQPFVIDLRPGGANLPAMEACKNAAPDGYTVCILSVTSHSLNPNVFSKLPYDPERDFTPIANLYSQIEALMVAANVPASNAGELKTLAVSKPGALNFGTLGQGSGPDLFRQWLGDGWNTRFADIPYKGGNLIITALVAGEIDLGWIGAYNAVAQQKSGKIRFLAIGSQKRLRLLPDVPTVPEMGLGDKPLSPYVAWGGPAGIPEAIVTRLSSELQRVFSDERFNEYLESQYLENQFSGPQELAAYMRKDREAFGRLVKKYNVPRQ